MLKLFFDNEFMSHPKQSYDPILELKDHLLNATFQNESPNLLIVSACGVGCGTQGSRPGAVLSIFFSADFKLST